MPNYTVAVGWFAETVELVGVSVIGVGFVVALIAGGLTWRADGVAKGYTQVRSTFGRAILLGLEILVAGDIIKTVVLQLTLLNIVVLGLLVVIRTFLAWSLELEIDGRWPWQRAGTAEG